MLFMAKIGGQRAGETGPPCIPGPARTTGSPSIGGGRPARAAGLGRKSCFFNAIAASAEFSLQRRSKIRLMVVANNNVAYYIAAEGNGMTATNDEFLFLLHDVARMMRTRADQRARRRAMTRAQWVILIWLERQPGLSQNELAALVEVEPITVGRLVDRLEARGLVERCADPKDRRVWRLRLTPAADAALGEIKDYRAELHDLITAGLDAAQVQTMTDGLLRMKANLLAEVREPPRASATS